MTRHSSAFTRVARGTFDATTKEGIVLALDSFAMCKLHVYIPVRRWKLRLMTSIFEQIRATFVKFGFNVYFYYLNIFFSSK